MAISVVMQFPALQGRDSREIYDEIIDEMGIRDVSPPGAVYHWCAEENGGLRVCDVWESREAFDAFAQAQIGPLTAKHGLEAPAVEITDVHEWIRGSEHGQTGTGVLVEFDGDTAELLRGIDNVNEIMKTNGDLPAGMAFHWSTGVSGGVRVYDHWRSREDFEHFAATRLGPASQQAHLPVPRVTFFEIHNVLDAEQQTTRA